MTKNDKTFDEMEVKNFYDQLMEDDDHYGVTSHHNGWAGNFHRYRLDFLRQIFINDLNVTKETEILDVGSSMSILAQIFSIEECPQITAFDISKIIIEKAKKKAPHINFSVDNAQNPTIKGEWDILHAGEIIEHLPNPKEALKNWNKLIKKDGLLVLSTPNGTVSRKTEEHIFLLSVNKLSN